MTRKPWVPERIDWVPGEPVDRISCKIREAVRSDWAGIRGLFRHAGFKPPSDSVLAEWQYQNKYVVRVAARNVRHVVAVCVSKHSAGHSRIVFVHTLPFYSTLRLPFRLLALAALEMPENPLYLTVRHDDDWVKDLSDNGWRAARVFQDDDTGEDLYDFRFGPLVGPGDLGDGPLGGAEGGPPAGGD